MPTIAFGLAVAIVMSSAAAASAGANPSLMCETSKLGTAGEYGACRLKAEAKALKDSVLPDYNRCDDSYSSKWHSAETKAGIGVCPTENDELKLGTRIAHHTGAIATLLSGGVPLDPYFPATGQTASYGAGDDGDLEEGATLSYVDNGDGTISDLTTGLMWEKKVGYSRGYVSCTDETTKCANPHNADNLYFWTVPSSPFRAYNGAAVTLFLNQLNNRCDRDTTITCATNADCRVRGGACGFAGYRDWRLPNVKQLQSIIDFSKAYPTPSVAGAFHGTSCGPACTDMANPACSCTVPDAYWSASTYVYNPDAAWFISFLDGGTYPYDKDFGLFVRAVRAGSGSGLD